MSSSGEMKISLRVMTCFAMSERNMQRQGSMTDILVPQMLEQLQLSIRALAQHRRAKGFHDLLDCDGLVGEVVFGGACGIGQLDAKTDH